MNSSRTSHSQVITLAAAVVSAITSSAATLNVPGTYADIASALAVAQDGDIVQVAAGEYTLSTVDPLDIPAGVTLKGAGAATTTVKAYANAVTEKVSASLLVATNLNCVIDGITFSGAYCYSDFSMPSVLDAAQGAVIKNCVFAGNTIKDKGYLARIMNAGTTLTNCVFRNTTLTGGNNYTSGSSVYVADAAEIMDCVFSNNFNRVNGGSGFVTLTTGAKVRRTTLAKNTLYSREKYQGTAPLTVLSTCTIDCLVEDCVLEDNAVGSDTAASKVYQAAGGLAIMGPATVRRR